MATPTNLPASFTVGQVLTAAQQNDLRGAFRVLRVVNATYGVATTNNTNVMADTGLTATITPQATSSLVLVLVSQNGCYKTSANAENRMNLRLMRGATTLTTFCNGLFLYTGTAIGNGATASLCYLDSPASTSALTYKTQFSNPNNTAGVITQESSSLSTITLMEISA